MYLQGIMGWPAPPRWLISTGLPNTAGCLLRLWSHSSGIKPQCPPVNHAAPASAHLKPQMVTEKLFLAGKGSRCAMSAGPHWTRWPDGGEEDVPQSSASLRLESACKHQRGFGSKYQDFICGHKNACKYISICVLRCFGLI